MTTATPASRVPVAPAETGRVVAVCTRRERSATMAKPEVPAIDLDPDVGVLADVHAGHGRRQVALIDLETLERLRAAVGRIDCGAMGENLVLAGVSAESLRPGARIVFAGGVVLEVTERRTPCVELDGIAPGLLRAAVGRCGVFARVLRGGRMEAGASFEILI